MLKYQIIFLMNVIHLTFSYAKRSYPKLELIKSYLRQNMLQERLSELSDFTNRKGNLIGN